MSRKQRIDCGFCEHRWMINLAPDDAEYSHWRLNGCQFRYKRKFQGVSAIPCKDFKDFTR